MPKIAFAPDGREVVASEGETIRQIANRHQIPLTQGCGGRARCTTCRTLILEGLDHCGPRTPAEAAIAKRMGFPPEVRLACQTHVKGDIRLRRLVLDEDDVDITSLFVNGPTSIHQGQEKFLCIMFADIRGFTSLSEALLPYDVIHILKRYFHRMEMVIEKHGGRIDNYMGDGFMALFETADPAEGARRSVAAGLEMLEEVQNRMVPYVRANWGRDFKIGIGLHSGTVVAGTIGSREGCKQTIIGDAVNLASRIESANKELGTSFLISERVRNLIKDEIREGRTCRIPIRGKRGEHVLYEVAGLK